MILECTLGSPLVSLYDLAPRQRVRILVKYDGLFRPVFWFWVGQDGSIYLGPRHQLTEAKQGAMPVDGHSTTIRYSAGERIELTGVQKEAKISVHASGHIHALDRRFRAIRSPLRGLKEQTLICLVLLKHPSTFAPVETFRNRDIPIIYPTDEERPFLLYIDAVPKKSSEISAPWVCPPKAIYWMNLLFDCCGLQGTPDLTLRLGLSHDMQGPWPPWNYLVFPSDLPNMSSEST